MCMVHGNVVYLPEQQLSNYPQVKSALSKAGGKYKQNTFVFPNDAKPYMDLLIGGKKVNIQKEFQFFATPKALASKLARMAFIESGQVVLEPSAGQGAIVQAVNELVSNVKIDVCELMELNQKVLRDTTNTSFICSDFLEIPDGYKNHYDVIIANPPFTGNQDIIHIEKMHECLKKSGRLVTIASNSWRTGSQKKQVAFREWLDEIGADIEDISAGEFKESGTMVGACIVSLWKI